MDKILQETESEKASEKTGIGIEARVGHWTFRLNLCSTPTLNYEGPSGIKGFLSLAELHKFKDIMEHIESARKELNRFPFPRYSHESLMEILEALNLGDVHEQKT